MSLKKDLLNISDSSSYLLPREWLLVVIGLWSFLVGIQMARGGFTKFSHISPHECLHLPWRVLQVASVINGNRSQISHLLKLRKLPSE